MSTNAFACFSKNKNKSDISPSKTISAPSKHYGSTQNPSKSTIHMLKLIKIPSKDTRTTSEAIRIKHIIKNIKKSSIYSQKRISYAKSKQSYVNR